MNSDLTTLPADQTEPALFAEMQQIDQQARSAYARMGLICQAVESRGLYQQRIDPDTGYPCRSFGRWLLMCSPYSNSTAYDALRDVKELADVPAVELAGMTRSNIATMKQLSSKVRKQPAVLEAAKGDQFVAYLQEHHPGQHVEHRSSIRLNPTEGQKAEIEEAVELAIQRGDATTKEEAIFGWAVNYKQECQDRIMEEGKCAHA